MRIIISIRKILLSTSFLLILSLFLLFPITYAAPTVDEMFIKQEEKDNEDNQETTEPPVEIEDDVTQEVDSPSFLESFLKLLVALIFVVALIYVVLKFINRKNIFAKKDHVIENLGGISVATNRSIQTIRIGNKFFVIGVGENIELLHEITDPDTIDQLLEGKPSDELSSKIPLPWLKKGTENGEKDQKNQATFSTMFQKELEGMVTKRKELKAKWDKKDSNKNE
ncbi:flagellar biosynthetic protein FliO [Saliterribacillus persicus]|uniref:Flagellar protein FliO/FliZ n=1 Tax=Saliterribacillus persicus TaxID=930114 RepID=A0A368XS61_9BACI|nr:flagellar biosynthetic protein FliO [Saliterribacillus persicus]RCW70705.1 flagellar protein FliO/FliZ [Saliterribacillus persicus]